MMSLSRGLFMCFLVGFAALLPLQAGTLDKIRSTHSATIGFSDVFPFAYAGPDGQPRGYNVDLCKRILDELDDAAPKEPIHLNFIEVQLSARTIVVANGTVDLMCALMTENETREQQVTFLTPTFVDNTKIMVRAESPIRSLADMKGKRLATPIGSSNMQIAREINKKRGLQLVIVPVKNHVEGAKLIDEGAVDGFMVSEIVLVSRAALARNWPYRILPEPLERRPRAIALNSADPQFRAAVEAALRKLVRSGDFERLYRRWFLSPIEPEGVTLGFKMDPSLEAWVKKTKTH